MGLCVRLRGTDDAASWTPIRIHISGMPVLWREEAVFSAVVHHRRIRIG